MMFAKDCHEAEGLKPPEERLQLLGETAKPVVAEPVEDLPAKVHTGFTSGAPQLI